jgi:hypothetical protein
LEIVAQIEVKEEHLKIARELAKMDEDSLFETLGVQTLGLTDPVGIKRTKRVKVYSFDIGFLREEGRRFFEENKEKLRRAICDPAPVGWDYCKKAEEYEKDFDKLIGALVPVVGSVLGLSGAVIGLIIVVCVILFKYGLRKFCECK